MVKFRHQKAGSLRKRVFGRPWWQYAVAVAVVILLGFMVQRFIKQGTIFGYKVRDVRSTNATIRGNNSGALAGSSKPAAKTNRACTDVSAQMISKAINDTVKTVGSFAVDITKPNLVSSCIFTSPTTKTTLSVLLREFTDQEKAKKTVDALAKAQGIEKVSVRADQAIYNSTANQLTVRKGARVTTITVTKNSKEKFDNKTTAIQVANILP